MFQPAKSYKHEWMDVMLAPKSYTVASQTGLTITFTGSAPEVGYVLDFKTASGGAVNAVVEVTGLA
jgi:hypothetical protein